MTQTPTTSQAPLFFDLEGLWSVLRNRFRMIFGITLLTVLVGALYVSFLHPQYTATAMVQLNVNNQPVISLDNFRTAAANDAAIQSELDIMRSPDLIRSVIEKYALDTKDELNPAFEKRTLAKQLKTFINGESKAPPSPTETMAIVTRSVYQRLSIRKDPLSYTVKILFTSRSPERASVVANAVAKEYLEYQAQSSASHNRQAHEWLSSRVDELRQKVLNSDRAVQRFIVRHDLYELDGQTLNDAQTSQLNAQLVEARTDMAQAVARLSHAQALLKSGRGIESVREVLSSPLIQSLREKEAELTREKSELAGHFGPQHPRMQNMDDEIELIRSKIAQENSKVVKALENELAIARVRVSTLQNELSGMRDKQGSSSALAIELAELKREAEANRALYENLLSQSKQVDKTEDLKQASAKIISMAQQPLSPSAPPRKLIMILFAIGGLFTGLAFAFFYEHFNLTLISPGMVERKTGLTHLGMVPEYKGRGTLTKYAVAHPTSLYTEALRNIAAAIQFNETGRKPRSILVVSALPHEGKGWLSSSLGRVEALSGKKVLLLDCDLHREKTSSTFDGQAQKTLNDYLSGRAEIADVIYQDKASGLYYISSTHEPKNIQGMLESRRMKALIEYAHTRFDVSLIDCPPVIGLSDVLFLSGMVDTALMAVQWNKTPCSVVNNALKTLKRAKVDISGAVLTRVDLDEYKKYEFGATKYFEKYSEYYRDTKHKKKSV